MLTLPLYAAKVDSLDVPSTVMKKNLRAAVVLPESYTKSRVSFPVLYLLHGRGGQFSDWLRQTPDKMTVHRLADQYNLIIVTPDGDPTSYYFDSPLVPTSQFETFIVNETQFVDECTVVNDLRSRLPNRPHYSIL